MSWNLQLAADILWLAIILGVGIWLFIRALKRSTNRPGLVFKWIFTAIVISFVFKEVVPGFRDGGLEAIDALFLMLICGGALAMTWGHSFIDTITKPLIDAFDGGSEPPVPKPYYSVAMTKRKLNKPLEAIAEIRKQLAQFPNDFEGVIMLAGVQAEDLKDLPGAEATLDGFGDSPGAPPKQVAAALTQLADWHLKLAQDAGAARAALEEIIARFPDTELSLQAAQRIARLGGTETILLAAHDRQPMALPEGVKNVGLLPSSEFLRPAEKEPGQLAAAYVNHLAQHPLDADIRERLAILYADHYRRLDMATAELRQLMEYPNQPARRVAHWLNLLADLQVRHGMDYDTVRGTVEKIIEKFPGTAVADRARTRLGRLKLELKVQTETPGVKLGVYEQRLGLKPGSLRRQP